MKTIVAVDNLSKRYGEHIAVDGVSFEVEEGEIFGVLGPNGAGKSTLVESIAGLRVPDAGVIRVLGLDPQRDKHALRRQLGVQLQDSILPDQIKVWEALDLYSSFYDHPRNWEQLLPDLGLTEKRNAVYRSLSGGQRQRLSIALALVGNPRIVILDELTTGLDPQARRITWQLIEAVRDQGVTVLLVTHFMEEAEYLCDRIALIDRGRLVALDTPSGIVARSGGEQRIRFRPSTPLDEHLLRDLPEVHDVTQHGSTVIVTGVGELLTAVTSVLARHQIIAYELRLEQANLDDAFIALTGRKLANS